MKKLIFTTAILCGCLLFKTADAQVSVSAGVNIGVQPDWGPVGYDNAQYYYMPEIGAYYDVPAHMYVYRENNVWIHRGVLPPRFGNFDRYRSYKAVINERNPWERDDQFRARYANYRGRRDQAFIRDSRDARYRNHWMGDRDRSIRNRSIHNRQENFYHHQAQNNRRHERNAERQHRNHDERGHDGDRH